MIRKYAVWCLFSLWSVGAFSQNAPISRLNDLTLCEGLPADIAITVENFNNIGAISLTWTYDPAVLSFQSFTNNSGFPGLMVMNPSPGVITAAGFSIISGITLPDSAVLYTAHFNSTGGTTTLEWFDNGESCEYTGPPPQYMVLNDVPQDLYFIDGLFALLEIPEQSGPISGPTGGNVCQGQADVIFYVDPLVNATGYNWTLPSGCQITSGENTHSILVSFAGDAISGPVSVYGYNQCGDGLPSLDFSVIVNSPPEITSQPVSPDTVFAGLGTAVFTVEASGTELSFQWQEYANEWTNLTEGGMYAGVYSDSLIITNPLYWMDGYKYRCIVNGFCDPPALTDGLATLTVSYTTGFDAFYDEKKSNKEIEIFVYPNPFKNWFYINYLILLPGQIKIEIINPKGEIIERFVEHHEYKGSYKICYREIHDLPGVYVARVSLKTNQGVSEEEVKMIKMN